MIASRGQKGGREEYTGAKTEREGERERERVRERERKEALF